MLAIIQARTNSKRFPKKILKKIYGERIITYVYKNVCKSRYITKTIIATSKNKTDEDLIFYLKKNKINFFRGDLNNVAYRLLVLAKKQKAKYFIRISGDSPLIDSKIIDRACKLLIKHKDKYDLITNIFPKTYPKGQSVEIIRTSILDKNINKFSINEKEHVTKYFYKKSNRFKIKNFAFKGKYFFNQAIDYKKDLEFVKKKFKSKFLKNL